MVVQYADDPLDLLDIAVNGRGHLFPVKVLEPRGLAVVGTLARGLEEDPLGVQIFSGPLE